MNVSRMLMIGAALCFAAASADAGQGAGSGRGSGRAQAPAARGAAQGPKVDRPAQGPKGNRPAQGPKAERAARPAAADRAIAENIARNPQLEARVKAMLPEGMTLEQASEGFRNQGQFIAVLQASKNLDIKFVDLKAEMTGDTPLTLGQAIQKLKPSESDAAR